VWPIHIAAELGDADLLRRLLRAKADATQDRRSTGSMKQPGDLDGPWNIPEPNGYLYGKMIK